uniref:Chitin-binding type-2 domain-containing protein n=1 Tax=Strigamia maritima TaxID=126957 RepID=T1J0R1_STRMM
MLINPSKMKIILIVVACVAIAYAAVVKRQAAAAYELPDGAELIVGGVKGGFSCSGRQYGYYADVDNNCRIFHICVHHLDAENGIDEIAQFSFFCGNTTVFDQENLVCVHADNFDNCAGSTGLYDAINSRFGIVDKPSVIAIVIGAVSAQYVLPDGAEFIVGNIQSTFVCAGREYGYYADVDNNCQIFHVCLPIPDDLGNIIDTAQYSFFCGNQTIFDQANLVCALFDDATPCNVAPSLYDEVNRNFGVIPPRK